MFCPDYPVQKSPSRDVLTSEGESSFFRSWALRPRRFEYSSSSDVSPGSRTPVTSPISPRTVAPRPIRPPLRETLSRLYPANHPHYVQSNQHQPHYASPQVPLSAATHERTTSRSRGSGETQTSRANSNASSLARRALSLFKDSTSSRKPSVIQHGKPSGLTRTSVAWKRESSGHWLEIRVGKKEPGTTSTGAQDPTSHVHYSPSLASHTATRMRRAIAHSKSKVSLRPPTRDSTNSSSPEGKPKETLVDRTKRILGIKSSVSLSTQQPTRGGQQSTAENLDRTSAALQNLVELTPPSGSSTSNMSTTSIGNKPKHRTLLRPRYHRHHTGHSSSSSVRRIMLGGPPVTTPNDECMYTGSDSQQYFRVELTAPHAPTYLPSEARRIGTPPLPETKGRGFFFDYNPPHSPSQSPPQSGPWPTEPMNTTPLPPRHHHETLIPPPHTPNGLRVPRTHSARSQTHDPDGVDWFRVKVALGHAEEERGGFELHVPEHLPSSPLCPRHPKHKSGGKGVCVYHGRNKMGPDDVVEEREGLWR